MITNIEINCIPFEVLKISINQSFCKLFSNNFVKFLETLLPKSCI